MRLHYIAWIHEVCQHPDLLELRARNERRLQALKDSHSLTEKHERSSSESAAAGINAYIDLRNCGNVYVRDLGNSVVDGQRASEF